MFPTQARFVNNRENRHRLKITHRVRVVICERSFIKLQLPMGSSGCRVTQTQAGKIPEWSTWPGHKGWAVVHQGCLGGAFSFPPYTALEFLPELLRTQALAAGSSGVSSSCSICSIQRNVRDPRSLNCLRVLRALYQGLQTVPDKGPKEDPRPLIASEGQEGGP